MYLKAITKIAFGLYLFLCAFSAYSFTCNDRILGLKFNKLDGGADITINENGNYSPVGTAYNLEAISNAGATGSVRFTISGPAGNNVQNLETSAPWNSGYSLNNVGSYTVFIEIFSSNTASTANKCHDTTFHFTISNCTPPNAGPDKSTPDIYSAVTLGATPASGASWVIASSNPGYSELSSTSSAAAIASAFMTAGTYKYIWTKGGCSDTMQVVVGSCNCDNNLVLNPGFESGNPPANWTATQPYNVFQSDAYAAQCGSGHSAQQDGISNTTLATFYQDVSITGGSPVTLKFKAGTHVPSDVAKFGLIFFNGNIRLDSVFLEIDHILGASGSMEGYTINANAPASANKVRVIGKTGADWLKVDLVCLQGTAGSPCDGNRITGLFFNELSSGNNVTAIQEGSSYDINTLSGGLLNLEATVSGNVESVKFMITGPTASSNIENFEEWNAPGTGTAWIPSAGAYSVQMQAYTLDDAGGTKCHDTTIHFTISNCTPPNAGPDKTTPDIYSSVALSATPTSGATWVIASTNPGYSELSSTSSATAIASAFMTAGTYKYIWTKGGGCSDTMQVVVGSCNCDNNLVLNPSFETGNPPVNWIATQPYNVFQSDAYAAQCGSGHSAQQDGISNTTLATFYQDVSIAGGSPVTLKFKAGTHVPGDVAKFGLIFFNGNTRLDSVFLEIDHILGASGSMEGYTINANAPTSANKVRVIGKTGADWLKVDLVCLQGTAGSPCDGNRITGLFFNELSSGNNVIAVQEGGNYDINTLSGGLRNLEATVSGNVESVKFIITGPTASSNIENLEEWNAPGTGTAWIPSAGAYSVQMQAYTLDDAGGTKCHDTTVHFNIIVPCSGRITELKFNHASGGTDLPITEGGNYDINTIFGVYNLQANTSGTVGSVKFTVSGPSPGSRTDDVASYTYPGRSGTAWQPVAGSYSIHLQVYSAAGAAGNLCHDTTITLNLTNICSANAGTDKTICFGQVANMTASGSGTWTARSIPANPGTATIVTPTGATTQIKDFSVAGTYGFVWTSGGCSDTALVVVNIKPNAGPDQSTCLGGSVIMQAVSSGTWTARTSPANPGTVTIVSTGSPTTTINNFSASGTYGFVWSNGTCTDTALVVVGACCDGRVTGLHFNKISDGSDLSISNGDNFPVSTIAGIYNLEASVMGTVQSVKFIIAGPTASNHIDNTPSYNAPATGTAWNPAAGNYSVKVEVYSADNAGGIKCHDSTFSFTISDPNCTCPDNLVLNPSFETYTGSLPLDALPTN